MAQNGLNGVGGGRGTRLVVTREKTYLALEDLSETDLLGNTGGSEEHAHEGREKALEGNGLLQEP